MISFAKTFSMVAILTLLMEQNEYKAYNNSAIQVDNIWVIIIFTIYVKKDC